MYVAIAVTLVAGLALLALSDTSATVVSDLQAPRGLTALDDGSLLIAEVLGGRLLSLPPDAPLQVIRDGLPATLGGPTETYPTGISAAVYVDETYYFVVGEFRGPDYSALYRLEPGDEPQLVAGGVGRDGFPTTPLTNPYDLVPAPESGFFVSDSGANAVFRVETDGTILEYATFPRRENPQPGIHATIDVVPTGLAYGPDGALYVASLTGIPYPSGAARIYRMEDRNDDGDALDAGETSVYAAGFSVATDLTFDADGSLLVTEFSRDMPRLVRSYSLEEAAKVPGRLVRWRDGNRSVVAHWLVSPTGVAVVDGRVFVSEEFAGRVTEIRPQRQGVHAWVPFAFELGLAAAVLVFLAVGWWSQRTRTRD